MFWVKSVGEEPSIRKGLHMLTALYVLTEYYWNPHGPFRMLLPKSEVGSIVSSHSWVPGVAAALAQLREVELC